MLLPQSWQRSLSRPTTQVKSLSGARHSSETGVDDDHVRMLLAAPSVQDDMHVGSSDDLHDVSVVAARREYCSRLLHDWPHALLTTTLVAVSVIIGIAVPNVEVVLAYKGALGGSWIIYIFPGCVWFALQQMHRYAVLTTSNAQAVFPKAAGLQSDSFIALSRVTHRHIWKPTDIFGTARGWLMLTLVAWGLVVLFVGTITTALGYNG
jgi:hypothetical protein